MPSYYNGQYIAQAIESILSQKTDYKYEIVINDDCSKDNSWNIISEYAMRFPDIISAKRNETNIGLCANVLDTKLRCKGKYIVNLSADDYWIDENKIQKQVDFLENHSEYIGVGSKVEIRYDSLEQAVRCYPSPKHLGKDYTINDFNEHVNLPSHGFMMRNIFKNIEHQDLIRKVYNLTDSIDDIFDPALYLQFGKIYIMKEATCVYRVQAIKEGKKNFNSSMTPLNKAEILINGYNRMETLGFEGVNLLKRYTVTMNLAILSGITSGNITRVKELYQSIPVKYKKPFYNSVLFHCLFWGVISTGIRQTSKRIKQKLALKKLKNRLS